MRRGGNIFTVLLTILATVSWGGVYSAEEDIYTPGERSAVEFRYQKGEWQLPRFDSTRTVLSRFYLTAGGGVRANDNTEQFATNRISQWQYNIGVGYRFTPVHSMELTLNKASKFTISTGYYMNLNNIILGDDYRSKIEVFWGASLDYEHGEYNSLAQRAKGSLGASTSFRVQYNPLNCLSVYVEPKISASSSMTDGYSLNVRPAINFGVAYYFNKPDDVVINFFMPIVIKTNLLYDLAITPNIGIEIPFSDRFSFTANIMRGWWLKSDNSFAWQLQAYDVGGRVWLGDRESRDKLTGWFVGAFFSAGFYDFQLQETQGVQGDFYLITGAGGGYALRLNRSFGLEFELGVGYLVSDFQKYDVVEKSYLVKSDYRMKFQSFMPVKAAVSLTYRLFNRD